MINKGVLGCGYAPACVKVKKLYSDTSENIETNDTIKNIENSELRYISRYILGTPVPSKLMNLQRNSEGVISDPKKSLQIYAYLVVLYISLTSAADWVKFT